jgi:hypothetical protein
MRYRESAEIDPPRSQVHPDLILGTAIYTAVLGMAFIAFGLRKRQRWLAFWGATMILAGGAYGLATMMGFS